MMQYRLKERKSKKRKNKAKMAQTQRNALEPIKFESQKSNEGCNFPDIKSPPAQSRIENDVLKTMRSTNEI